MCVCTLLTRLQELGNMFLGLVKNSSRQMFIILDAVEQLKGSHATDYLFWLPTTLPKHIKVIISMYLFHFSLFLFKNCLIYLGITRHIPATLRKAC